MSREAKLFWLLMTLYVVGMLIGTWMGWNLYRIYHPH